MNKLAGILASTVVCALGWALANYIAYGMEAKYAAVLTIGSVSGLVIGLGCAIFSKVNPIFMGVTVLNSIWLGLAAFLVSIGVGHMPSMSLELVWIVFVMSAMGAASGFSYKLGARV